MKKSELKKLFEKAKIEKVEEDGITTMRVYVKKLDREYHVQTEDEAEARTKALEMVVNEPEHLRGFKLTS